MKLILLLLYCYFFVFVFGQLTRFTIESSEISVHFADIVVALIVLFWAAYKLFKREKVLLPSLTNQILSFFLLASISLAMNSSVFAAVFRKGNLLEGREMIVAWLYLFRWIFYAGLYFVVYDLVSKFKGFEQRVINSLIYMGLLVGILGLIQYLFLPDTRFLEVFGWDPHYYRLIGTFLDPGFTGAILALTLVLLTPTLLSKPVSSQKKNLILWVIVYVALALTYSRASYLAYLTGMGVIAFLKNKPKFFLMLLLLGIVTIFVLPRPGGEGVKLGRESTVRFRIINWEQSIIISKDHLLWGVGFNAYRYSQRDYGFLEFANWRASHAGGGADSSLFFVLATTGIFGLICFLWLWTRMMFLSIKMFSLEALASLAALLVHSFFVNSLFYPWIMAWYWILLATMKTRAEN